MSIDQDFNRDLRGWGILLQSIAAIFPDLILFNFIRVLALKMAGAKILSATDLVIRRNVFVEIPKNLNLGKNVQINVNCYIGSNEKVSVGDGTRIGMNVHILTTNHHGLYFEHDDYCPVTIENLCHIGAGAIILPGTHIEKYTIIAPGAVVTGRTKTGGVYAGNPARLTAMRSDLPKIE